MYSLESKETSKRHSGINNYNSNVKSVFVNLKDSTTKPILESQVQTQRRDESKLVVKLKNDI